MPSMIVLALLLAAQAHGPAPRPAYLDPPVARCPPATDGYARWVTGGQPGGAGGLVPKTAFSAIPEIRRPDAVQRLEATAAVALAPAEAAALLGSTALTDANPGLKPFLVRNVVATFGGEAYYGGPVRVATAGGRLYISAAILGCGGFFKNPLVVMLPKAPEGVEIQAVAAL